MKRFRFFLAAVMLAAVMVAWTAPTFAVSPSEEQCEAEGGTFTRVQGKVRCVTVEEGKNPKFQEEKTTGGQGNISNKQETSTECKRPGQTEKCPPGQF